MAFKSLELRNPSMWFKKTMFDLISRKTVVTDNSHLFRHLKSG